MSPLLCPNSVSASFGGAFQRQLCHNATQRLSQFEGSSKCGPQMRASFWRMHRYDPSWNPISQGSLCAQKRRKKERKWRHHMAHIVTFAGLGGRNRDIRVKHLVTQPGSAPKARPSHLTTVDVAFEGLSKGLAFEDRKGRVLQRMQTLN